MQENDIIHARKYTHPLTHLCVLSHTLYILCVCIHQCKKGKDACTQYNTSLLSGNIKYFCANKKIPAKLRKSVPLMKDL